MAKFLATNSAPGQYVDLDAAEYIQVNGSGSSWVVNLGLGTIRDVGGSDFATEAAAVARATELAEALGTVVID